MKLPNTVIPDWLGNGIVVLVVIAGAPVIATLGALAGAIWLKRRSIGPDKNWSRWFAWYPVRVDFNDQRWLEMVERRSFGILCDTHHRAIKRGDAA